MRFIFALSPGMDLGKSILQGSRDKRLLARKMEDMYAIGIRDFAVFFDDIEERDGRRQADLLNWLDENFLRRHPDVSPLITVPTEYFRRDMQEETGEGPQLMQMQRIAEADKIALELMKSVRAGDARKSGRLVSLLEKKRGEIARKERKAKISEKTARAFLDEVLAYAAGRNREDA